MQIQENKLHFFNLDILRFIAVFMVLFYHLYLAYSGWFASIPFIARPDGSFSFFGSMINKLFLNGDLGVDLFFLISGFLITYLLLKERANAGKINIKNFYARRALRIWPLYFLIIALTPFLAKISDEQQPHYLWTMLFATNFETIKDLHGQFPFIHYWSVCVEEHFYLIWPIIIAFVPHKRMPHCFAALIVFSIAFRAYAFFEMKEWYMHEMYNTISRMDVLVIGSWIGYRHFTRPIQLNIPRFVRILVYITFIFGLMIEKNHDMNTPFDVTFKKYFFCAGFLFGFANYMFNPDSFFNFSKKNILHYLGKISYGIYMYHNIIWPFFIRKIMYNNGLSNFFVFLFLYLLIVLTISIVSYELIEKRILRLKDRFAVIKTGY